MIVDEIHALVGTKRGAHLALSLERLEEVARRPLQRIGLSATQRPLEEVARYLGGGEGLRTWKPRPVTIVDAGAKKAFDLRVEVPVEDMARLGEALGALGATRSPRDRRASCRRRSIWPAIHPRLLELVRAHRSTILFVNSRRLAERLAAALNELAGEEIARAHHGSIARDERLLIEDALKAGRLPALVATSSLELGIDMGAVDLVVQIETPTSVASGMQRIGRASHQVEAVSRGIIFPKYRGDLLASAAITKAMKEGAVEETRVPRNPLDVLAQQLAAMVALGERKVDELYALARRAAPYSGPGPGPVRGRPRHALGPLPVRRVRGAAAAARVGPPPGRREAPRGHAAARRPERRHHPRPGPLRRLPRRRRGRRPARGRARRGDGLREPGGRGLRPRRHELADHRDHARPRARRARARRAGEDAVLEGRPRGAAGGDGPRDRPPHPRAPRHDARSEATERLQRDHDLDPLAAQNLLAYLEDQREATGVLPDDRTIVLERTRDEMGDWRLCLLSPWGGRVHAPWATALEARLRQAGEAEVESIWSDDGIVLRLPERERPPEAADLLPEPEEIEDLVVRELGGTSLFAARFREAAARALLLPRRRPGHRTPLWMQRKRAHDLLQVAARYPSFPIVLEAYRECLRDVFDLPGLVEIASRVRRREIRLVTVDTQAPSPFSASLLFGYVANYLYEGDAPLAERRAQALAVDQAQLRELLGESELRELVDRHALAELELALQCLDAAHQATSPERLHDLLLRLGDLSRDEAAARVRPLPDGDAGAAADAWLGALERERRAIRVHVGGEERWAAAEDAGRLRDALGIAPPPGPSRRLPRASSLTPSARSWRATPAPTARSRRPKSPVATRRARRPSSPPSPSSRRTAACSRASSGPGATAGSGAGRTSSPPSAGARSPRCASRSSPPSRRPSRGSSRTGRASPVAPATRRGPDALLDVVEQLQGAAFPASILERDVLPARIPGYRPGDLDTLSAAGEVVWVGLGALGDRDGRHRPLPGGRPAAPPAVASGGAAGRRPRRGFASTSPATGRRSSGSRRRGRRRPGPPGRGRPLGPGVGGRGHERHAGGAARLPGGARRPGGAGAIGWRASARAGRSRPRRSAAGACSRPRDGPRAPPRG